MTVLKAVYDVKKHSPELLRPENYQRLVREIKITHPMADETTIKRTVRKVRDGFNEWEYRKKRAVDTGFLTFKNG